MHPGTLATAASIVLFLAVAPAAAAPIKQLFTKDLKPGDILIKVDNGAAVSTIIQKGQKAFGQMNADKTHAGLMYDNNYIIESQGPGVVANDLRVGNKPYGYIVFRSTDAKLSAGAAEFAKILFDAHKQKATLKYSVKNACLSLMKKSKEAKLDDALEKEVDAIVSGASKKFFCSQMVVFVYQFAGRQNGIAAKDVFLLDDALVSPAKLAELLVDNTKYFEEVGYLMPDER